MVHRVQRTDLDAAADLLARAMRHYPVFEYVAFGTTLRSNVPARAGEDFRDNGLRHVLRFILGAAVAQGEVVAPTPALEAVAVWARSDSERLSLFGALRAGLVTLPIKAGLHTTRRLFDVAQKKRALREKLLECPCYVLDMLGVDPKLRNQGYGRLLLEAKLREIDHEHAPCYLETSEVNNIDYYRRYGFNVIHEHSIETLPVYCLMRRRR